MCRSTDLSSPPARCKLVDGHEWGYRLDQQQTVTVAAHNLLDRAHRGMAWGMPGPGRGLRIRWSASW